MATVIAPASLDQHQHHYYAPRDMSAPHGTKRPADHSLDGEQRLSKRFDRLNLDHGHSIPSARLYTPLPTAIPTAIATSTPTAIATPIATSKPISTPTATPATTTPTLHHGPTPSHHRHRPPRHTPTDAMPVDDTPHRVYIHDLAAELSDTDTDTDTDTDASEDDRPLFLPHMAAHLSQIPRHVLLGPAPTPTIHNQLVLYSVPSSLTVSEDQDSVRKAIGEARQRAREKLGRPDAAPDMRVQRLDVQPDVDVDVDVDAMDID